MAKIIVYHGEYGCGTGCCGHWVKLDGEREKFVFSHPYNKNTDLKQWAKDIVEQEFGQEHVADLDWENCIISDGDSC